LGSTNFMQAALSTLSWFLAFDAYDLKD
jgi:hypothetical protein